MYKEIQTDRLIIRPIKLGDSDFICSLVNSNGWLKFIGDRNIRNSDDAEKYIQKILENTNYYYNVFEIYETQQPIGIITFLNRDSQEFPDIGFALLPQFEKKGYTFEASKKYLQEIISQKLHKKIIGITVPENENSIKLLLRLGLQFEKNFKENNEELSLYSMTTQ
jgi:[ribosomal protein S5]-alanine N-acetyltransferase